MQIESLRDLVLICRFSPAEISCGGLIIPNIARAEQYQGVVVAVGPGRRSRKGQLVPPCVKAGDRVLFNRYSGTDFTLNGVTHIIMRERELLAVVEDK